MGLQRARDVALEVYGETAPLEDVITWSEWSLARVGFRPTNCLAVVDVCRDELMAGVDEAISATWGRPFQVGALGAMVLVGRTGMQAALGHVPGEDGRHRFVVFCLPHIGVDENGTVGRVQRRGMYRETSACGALAAFREQLAAGERDFAVESDDIEQSLLRRRLAPLVPVDAVPDLVQLTELARRAAVEDTVTFIDRARGSEPVDVACISGVVLHLPEGVDLVASVQAEVVIDGVARALPH